MLSSWYHRIPCRPLILMRPSVWLLEHLPSFSIFSIRYPESPERKSYWKAKSVILDICLHIHSWIIERNLIFLGQFYPVLFLRNFRKLAIFPFISLNKNYLRSIWSYKSIYYSSFLWSILFPYILIIVKVIIHLSFYVLLEKRNN